MITKLLRKAFLTLFFSGLSPKAPGTVGSFVALIMGVALIFYVHVSTLFLLAMLISVIAVKEINKYEEYVGEHDSKEIVIDELAGMWIALAVANVNPSNFIVLAPLAFIFFRLFDIWKPSIIGKIDERVKGGWGVMGDDIVAGIAAGVAANAVAYLLMHG